MKGADGESGWSYDGFYWWVRCHAASTVPWIVKVREGPIEAINDGLSPSPPPNRTSCVPAAHPLMDAAGKSLQLTNMLSLG